MFDSSKCGSFGGLSISSLNIADADIILVSIPYEGGTEGKKGTAQAPDVLRDMSTNLQTVSRMRIDISGLKIKDMGNILTDSMDRKKTREIINGSFKQILNYTKSPIIFVGGDHSITSCPMALYNEAFAILKS